MIKECFDCLYDMCSGGLDILGTGTTGSGRHLAGRFIETDVVHNEITAQMKSTHMYFPDANTIFEIGGQDSKYIHMKDGHIRDFTMNKICSAGTGSFLEEQAEQLGIRIEDQFASTAACSVSPFDLGSRCTVFMDTELVNALSKGVTVSDISAGLAYSIAENYLEKVVENRPVGENIVFQGGVASNPAVVKAFSVILGKPVHVHPHNRISGAIGAALIARDRVEKEGRSSPAAGSLRDRIGRDYEVTCFECCHCSNRCQVNRITIEEETIYFGDTCERYTAQQRLEKKDTKTGLPDLFRERKELLYSHIRNLEKALGMVGLPMVSFMTEALPFWAVFFNRLGFRVKPSPPSNSVIFEEGLKKLPAETCLPIKLAFGHPQWFADRGVDWIFLPSLIDPKPRDSVPLCPYAENVPFMVRAAVDVDLLSPRVDLNSGVDAFLWSLAPLREKLKVGLPDLKKAFEAAAEAQKDFYDQLRIRGENIVAEASANKEKIWVILGKPYNLHDKFLNLNLARHLKNLGVLAVPIDFLDPEGESDDWPGMPIWWFNQRMLKAALWAADKPGVYPVIITNFGCGPDAFGLKHFARILRGKHHLVLEFDEHRAEAGLITRLEAFMDEIRDDPGAGGQPRSRSLRKSEGDLSKEELKERTFIMPHFADHVFAFSGAFKAMGFSAERLSPPGQPNPGMGGAVQFWQGMPSLHPSDG